uniref:Uncharacterized protein n=1 Tax=Anguilla anguilla TaxID=7936 RepID=A0A0E9P8N0_ANGAN
MNIGDLCVFEFKKAVEQKSGNQPMS